MRLRTSPESPRRAALQHEFDLKVRTFQNPIDLDFRAKYIVEAEFVGFGPKQDQVQGA